MMKARMCPSCGKGLLEKADNIVSEIGGYVFVEKGERCPSCGQEFPFEEESRRTIAAARTLGVWGAPLTLQEARIRGARSGSQDTHGPPKAGEARAGHRGHHRQDRQRDAG